MKYISLLILSFALYTIAYSQSVFNKRFDFDNNYDGGWGLSRNYEGSLIVGGSGNINQERYCFIVNVSCSGDSIWSRKYNLSNGFESIRSIQKTPLKSYAMAGEAYNSTYNIDNYFLFKTDRFGNLKWLKFYGDSVESQCWDMIATKDSGFLLIGNTFLGYDTINGYIQAWLVKTDSLGNVQWEHRYGGVNAEYVYGVKQTTDGGYIVAGQTASLGTADNADMWLFKIDSEGNMQWQQAYGTSDNDWGGGGTPTFDGGYIITGTLSQGVTPIACIIKTDSGGNEQWRKTYGYNYHESFKKVFQLSDSGYIAMGSINLNPQVGFQGWLARFNSSGDTLWTKMFGGPSYYDDYFYGFTLTDDGGFAMAGVYETAHNVPPYQDMWLVKTDSNGCALPECDNGCDPCTYIDPALSVSADTIDLQYNDTIHFYDQSAYAQHWYWNFGDGTTDTVQNPLHVFDTTGTYNVMMIVSFNNCSDTAYNTVVVINSVGMQPLLDALISNFHIFPNPAKESVTISLLEFEPAEIIIYNMQGVTLFSQQAHEKKTVLNINSFERGVYTVKVQTGKGLAVRKLVKE